MKKKIITLAFSAAMILGLAGCGQQGGGATSGQPTTSETVQKYMVYFKVDGAAHKTVRVEAGSKITEEIPEPSKAGFEFEGWYEDEYAEGKEKLNFETYIVTKSVTFVAHFVAATDPELNINDVPAEGSVQADYTLVVGWWEVADPEQPDKVTSGLTPELVNRTFNNVNRYLRAIGKTEAEIAKVSYRNYSTKTVKEMGDKITNEGLQAEFVIGGGANFFNAQDASSAGTGLAPYYATGNESRFQAVMGASGQSRYVDILKQARPLAVEIYNWLKENPAAFTKKMSDAEVAKTLQVDLTVTIHGDTDAQTHLTDKETALTWPEITIAEGKEFKGLATSAGGEAALKVSKGAELKYLDLKALADGAETLDLYPVIEDIPVVQEPLKVYIQAHGSKLKEAEANLLIDRFKKTLAEGESVEAVIDVQSSVSGANFKALVDADSTADVVVGGNNPVDSFDKAEGYVTAGAGAKHFADGSRKVVVLNTVDTPNKALADKFYEFVKADAEELNVHAALWARHDNKWMTTDEIASVTAAIKAQAVTYMGVADEETLASTYNVTVTAENVATEGNATTVAAFVTATDALRDGKGTDLIVACGSNIDTNTTVVEKKNVDTAVLSKDRYVALINDIAIARSVYEVVFPAKAAA